MQRFSLAKDPTRPGWWVVTDTEAGIALGFREHEYNETQEMVLIDDSPLLALPPADQVRELAHAMRLMADYMFTRWYSIALPVPPHEFRRDDDGDRLLLMRNKHPRFTLEIQDGCTADELAAALRKAAEFVRKYRRLLPGYAGLYASQPPRPDRPPGEGGEHAG